MKILIYGLSGSGKSTLAHKLADHMILPIVNGDTVREKYRDWDFSIAGRKDQAIRMHKLAEDHDIAIVDFICPFKEYQDKFDIKILMDTVTSSKFPDTDALFERGEPDITINTFYYNIHDIIDNLRSLLT